MRENLAIGAPSAEPLSPEARLLCEMVQSEAAHTASTLASTWYLRLSRRRRSSADEFDALLCVASLSGYEHTFSGSDAGAYQALPSETVRQPILKAFEIIQFAVPYSDEELLSIHERAQRVEHEPAAIDEELVTRWTEWLRCPTRKGVQDVTMEAQLTHDTCVQLYRHLRGLTGHP
jgi:hypothetical protein